jgi:hypothetical protein
MGRTATGRLGSSDQGRSVLGVNFFFLGKCGNPRNPLVEGIAQHVERSAERANDEQEHSPEGSLKYGRGGGSKQHGPMMRISDWRSSVASAALRILH